MRVTSGDGVNEGVDEYIVYRIDVSLGFSHTATELNGWCPPKSAVCGFHLDNDIGTLDLLAKKVSGNAERRKAVFSRSAVINIMIDHQLLIT
jgi:hypothetical protein